MTNPVEFHGRYEDAGFLRGEGCYTADITVEGMAHGGVRALALCPCGNHPD